MKIDKIDINRIKFNFICTTGVYHYISDMQSVSVLEQLLTFSKAVKNLKIVPKLFLMPLASDM